MHQKPEEPTKRSVAVSEVSRDEAFVEFSGNKEFQTKKLAQTTSRKRFHRDDGGMGHVWTRPGSHMLPSADTTWRKKERQAAEFVATVEENI